MELLPDIKLSDNAKYQQLNEIINKDTTLAVLDEIYIYYSIELLQKYGHKFYETKKIPNVFKILIKNGIFSFITNDNELRFKNMWKNDKHFTLILFLIRKDINDYTIEDDLDSFNKELNNSKTKYIVSFFIIVLILLFVFLKKNVFENFSGGKNIYKNDYKKLKKYSLTKFLYN
jgi:hypothetical protein